MRRYRKVAFGRADAIAERGADGIVRLRSPHALPPYPDKITERIEHWAKSTPDQVLFAQREADGSWRSLTYSQARARARRVAEALLRRKLSVERPLVVLSGNDIEHALLQLAALYIGVPYAPVSPAYSLVSSDFAQLRHVVGLVTPGLVYAADRKLYGSAIRAAIPQGTEVLFRTDFAALESIPPSPAVEHAHARVGPDTIAKFLFTWCSNQAMVRAVLAFVQDEPPIMVDWAPWHHTAGGNKDLGMVMFNGGTLYIDEGKPLPGAIETTVRNLREIAPNWYFTVPKGYEALLPYLRQD